MLNKHTIRKKPFPWNVLGLRVRFAELPNGSKSPNTNFQFVMLHLLGIFKRQGRQKKPTEKRGKEGLNQAFYRQGTEAQRD